VKYHLPTIAKYGVLTRTQETKMKINNRLQALSLVPFIFAGVQQGGGLGAFCLSK